MGKAAALSVQHDQPLFSFCLSLGGRNVEIAFLFLSSYESMCLLVSAGMLPRAELTPAYASQPDLRTAAFDIANGDVVENFAQLLQRDRGRNKCTGTFVAC